MRGVRPRPVWCRRTLTARVLRGAGYEVEERRVPWRRGLRDDVDALTGQRVVPVVVLGREAICDSRRIVEHLAWRSKPASADAPANVDGEH